MTSDLLCPGKDDVLLQKVSVVQVFEDDGNSWQELDLVQLHDTLEASQQVLLGLLVVVAELREKKKKQKTNKSHLSYRVLRLSDI